MHQVSLELLMAGLGALSAAVCALWMAVRNNATVTTADLAQCHRDHALRTDEVIELTARVGKLEGHYEMADRVLTKLDELQAREPRP